LPRLFPATAGFLWCAAAAAGVRACVRACVLLVRPLLPPQVSCCGLCRANTAAAPAFLPPPPHPLPPLCRGRRLAAFLPPPPRRRFRAPARLFRATCLDTRPRSCRHRQGTLRPPRQETIAPRNRRARHDARRAGASCAGSATFRRAGKATRARARQESLRTAGRRRPRTGLNFPDGAGRRDSFRTEPAGQRPAAATSYFRTRQTHTPTMQCWQETSLICCKSAGTGSARKRANAGVR
jgi:hypothetical protein